MNLTKADIDSLFKQIGTNEEFAREIRRQARQIWNVAKDSEAFDNTLKGLFLGLTQSITAGGIVPKPFALALLVMFVLGQKYPNLGAPQLLPPTSDVPLTDEEIEKLRKEIDGIS